MKKTLDTTGIVNELRGTSAFFKGRLPIGQSPIEKSPMKPTKRIPKRTLRSTVRSEQPNEPVSRTVDESERNDHPNGSNNRTERATERSRRPTTRYSFEFYTDQILAIRKIRGRREVEGQSSSLSEVAREAFDEYIKRQKTEQPNG
jgi:hypothetical protein